MPKISVIVPVYKVEKYLNRCIDSILNQTFTDFECILVDDGSPDRCPQICDEYAKKDKRISVIHKQNGGQSDARNAGIDIAQGEYLSFIDSDDWVHPQMLEILYDGMLKKGVMLSICTYEEVKAEKSFKNIENWVFKIRNGMCFFIEDNITAVVPWDKLYHKSLFDGIRYPLDRVCEDEFVTYKLLYKAGDIAFCNEKLYMYFVNYEGLTKSGFSAKRMKDTYDALEERLKFFKNKREAEMCIYTEQVLFFDVWMDYNQINNSVNGYEYRKFLRNKMRKYLLLYSRKADVNVKKYAGFYEIAFPKIMRVYWLLDILKRKTASEGVIQTVKKAVLRLKSRKYSDK